MSSKNQRSRSPYKSPLEWLDEKTKRYSSKIVSENNRYKDLFEKGKCDLFEKPSSSYRYYHIHAETTIDIIDDLIDYANEITTYTLDTEDQMRYRQESLGALLQIEFIDPNNPTIIILIETLHLPPQGSSLFKKISQLCKSIFANGHRIYCWGEINNELKKMYRYGLFDLYDVNAVIKIDVQKEFKPWFNHNYPTSIDRKTKDNENFSLQKAIHLTFNEWLNKRLTLADWGCVLDVQSNLFKKQYHRVIADEIHIRQLMTLYAMNDCFSVTKLVNHMLVFDQPTPPPTVSSEETPEDKNNYAWTRNDDEQLIQLNPSNEIMITERVHVEDEFPVAVEPKENETNRSFETSWKPPEEVHVQYELQNDIQPISDDEDEQQLDRIERNQEELQNKPLLTKNQKKNLKKRANRYRFEIIRHVYYRFTTSRIKDILIYMDIYCRNINVVGQTLFVGMHSEQARQRVNQFLHEGMFTKKHFQRIEKRLHRRRSS